MVSVAKRHAHFPSRDSLMDHFERSVFLPAMRQLMGILDLGVTQAVALSGLKELMDRRQLPHLGPHYTRPALELLGWLAPGPDEHWVLAARHEVWAAQGVSAGSLVRTERIMAFVAAAMRFRDLLIEIPGRLFHAGVPPDADRDVCAQLQSTFRHMARDDHAERAALLSVTALLLKTCKAGTGALAHVTGTVRLYVSHFPCLSCVAVLGQFSRLADRKSVV